MAAANSTSTPQNTSIEGKVIGDKSPQPPQSTGASRQPPVLSPKKSLPFGYLYKPTKLPPVEGKHFHIIFQNKTYYSFYGCIIIFEEPIVIEGVRGLKVPYLRKVVKMHYRINQLTVMFEGLDYFVRVFVCTDTYNLLLHIFKPKLQYIAGKKRISNAEEGIIRHINQFILGE